MSIEMLEAGLAAGCSYRATYFGQQANLFAGEDAMYTVTRCGASVLISESQLTRLRQQWPGRIHLKTQDMQGSLGFAGAESDCSAEMEDCQ